MFNLFAGIFRTICTNGLVVSDGAVSRIKIRHNAAIVSDMTKAVTDIAANMPALMDGVNGYREIILTEPERLDFATKALALKYPAPLQPQPATQDAPTLILPPIEPRVILIPKRAEDRSYDLWSVLNTVQENLMNGGQRYDTRPVNGQRPQRRKAGAVNSISGNLQVNQGIWELARQIREARMSV